ncbi:MAG: hypothetical protein RRC07_07185 [Anaerolineae bacterium]|nr:hypothetical protein [Anaerolineae bacterium]
MTERTCDEARRRLNAVRAEQSAIRAGLEQADTELATELLANLTVLLEEEASLGAWMDEHGCDKVAPSRKEPANLNRINIRDLSGARNIPEFTAPRDSLAARSVWAFLVETLPEGYVVELEIPDEGVELTRESGSRLPEELYKRIMRGESLGDEDVR